MEPHGSARMVEDDRDAGELVLCSHVETCVGAAAAAMSFNSVSVVGNASRLRGGKI